MNVGAWVTIGTIALLGQRASKEGVRGQGEEGRVERTLWVAREARVAREEARGIGVRARHRSDRRRASGGAPTSGSPMPLHRSLRFGTWRKQRWGWKKGQTLQHVPIEPVDRVVVQDAGPRAIGYAVHKVEGLEAVVADHLPVEGGNQLLGWDGHVRGAESRSAPTSAENSTSFRQASRAARVVVSADQVTEGMTVSTSCGTIELTDEECTGHHVHKELLGAYLALLSRRLELRHKRVALFVDATASVAYLAKWGGPSQVMTRIVRRIWSLCAAWDIRIVQVSHISGTRMISVGVDALSRPYRFARGGEMDRDDWRLRESAFQWIQGMVWTVLGAEAVVDRMATRANRRLQRYNSVSSVDPEAESFSAFAVEWSEVDISYCFPPFALIPRVLQHIRECRAKAVVVVPDWPSQAWWRDLVSMSVAWWYFPEREVFERVLDGEWQLVTKMSFRPVVVVLDGVLTWG